MKNSELEDARQEVIEAACEWVTNLDFYESDLLRTLGIAVHNLLRLQKAEAIAYTACYPRDVAGAQPSATDYHKTPLALFGWGDSD